MKKIFLRGKCASRKFAQVDDDDYDLLMTRKWRICPDGYAISSEYLGSVNGGYKYKKLRMHKLILKGKIIDHIDGNRLNNQRKNIRTCTSSQNQTNRGKQKNNSSGYKGVTWHKRARKYVAKIQYDLNYYHLGLFDKEVDAAKAYNAAAIKYHGEFACLNEI